MNRYYNKIMYYPKPFTDKEKEGAISIAQRLRDKGLTVSQIALATGIPEYILEDKLQSTYTKCDISKVSEEYKLEVILYMSELENIDSKILADALDLPMSKVKEIEAMKFEKVQSDDIDYLYMVALDLSLTYKIDKDIIASIMPEAVMSPSRLFNFLKGKTEEDLNSLKKKFENIPEHMEDRVLHYSILNALHTTYIFKRDYETLSKVICLTLDEVKDHFTPALLTITQEKYKYLIARHLYNEENLSILDLRYVTGLPVKYLREVIKCYDCKFNNTIDDSEKFDELKDKILNKIKAYKIKMESKSKSSDSAVNTLKATMRL